jgi:hypothetical protein
MPSGKPADNPPEKITLHLESKLQRLEEMLALTRSIGQNPFGVAQGEAEAFRDQTCRLVSEIKAIDRTLKDCKSDMKAATAAPLACKDLLTRIKDTVRELARENADLMASIKAQQDILGEKILRLKKNKDLLNSYHPHGTNHFPLVDSTM